MENWEIVKAYSEGKEVLHRYISGPDGPGPWSKQTETEFFCFVSNQYIVEEPKTLTCLDFFGWWYKDEQDDRIKFCNNFSLKGEAMCGFSMSWFMEERIEFSQDLKTWVTWEQRQDWVNAGKEGDDGEGN